MADHDQRLTPLLLTEPDTEAGTMVQTIFERGEEQGERRILKRQFTYLFGPLSKNTLDSLAAWPADRLEELGVSLLKARSLQELGLEDGNAAAPNGD